MAQTTIPATHEPPAGVTRKQQVTVVDTDIHPAAPASAIAARLDEPWRTRLERYGHRVASPPMIYPRVRNGGFRLDSWPAGGVPGSDLGLVRQQLLDEYDVSHGILIPLQSHGFGTAAPEFALALCHALNEWIREEWLDREPRLRSSICVPHESPELVAREIERYADDPRFVQVLLPTGGETSFGRRKYWPIYAAAAEAGLPVAAHLGGLEQHRGAGWPSFYLEEHVWMGSTTSAFVMSLICEGVLEEFPDLQVVLVEGGVAWGGPLMWAMDTGWSLLRDDVSHLRRPPSEYLRENFWFTTQPIEEPDNPRHLAEVLDHMGMTDRIMFASDYPHWDFDAPVTALRHLPAALQRPILGENARRLYRLPAADGDGRR